MTVSHNSGAVNGGGVSAFGGTATVTDSSILATARSAYGGGVFTSSGTATVTGSTIANNTAYTSGGGVYAYGGTLTVTRRHDPRQHGHWDDGRVAARAPAAPAR